jgi:hypothetical protein
MSITMIRRGGAHGTRINHEKRNEQRELDVHGQRECRRQDGLSLEEIKISPDSTFWLLKVVSDQYHFLSRSLMGDPV